VGGEDAAVLGASGESCAACDAPLATDQRYCLNCGERRGPPRLDPLAHARGSAGAREIPPPPPPQGPRMPSPRVTGIATLLVLAFGIAAATAAGPHASATLASAPPRRTIIVVQAPAPGPAPVQPVPAGTPPPESTPAPEPEPSTPESSAPETSAPDSLAPETPAPTQEQASKPKQTTPDDSTPGDETSKPTVKHIWVVALTGHTMAEALADPSPMPYLSGTLRPKGLLLSGYNPALPGGLANLIAMISGQRPTAQQRGACPAYVDVDPKARTGCIFAKDVDTLPGQLTAVGKTWRAYVEDSDVAPDSSQAPDTCRHPAPGGPLEPVMARNPLLFFHAIVDTPDCSANTAGMSRLLPDSEDAESAPTFSLVIPNGCHDGADQPCAPGAPAGAAAADAWLAQQVGPLLASKAYTDDGMVVVTFDTGPDFHAAVGALVISDAVDAGGTDDGDYRPANLLRTFEDLFSLDPLGRAKDVHAVTVTKPSR
jgi:hypothetical protein